jgi:hypothetical protein
MIPAILGLLVSGNEDECVETEEKAIKSELDRMI